MSSTNHLTTTTTSETKINKSHSNFNWCTLPCDGSSNLLHFSSSPTTNSKYLYYVNAEPTRKQSIETAQSTTTTPASSVNAHRKLSAISLTVPWYKRSRTPSDDKVLQKPSKMSRDRLLPLDKLFSGGTHIHRKVEDDQASPINDLTTSSEPRKLNEKNIRNVKENGYLHNSSHLKTRLQYTTKGTKALRLLGDGGRKQNNNAQQDKAFNPKESVLNKTAPRGSTQRRLLLKNGDVNISRYIRNVLDEQIRKTKKQINHQWTPCMT